MCNTPLKQNKVVVVQFLGIFTRIFAILAIRVGSGQVTLEKKTSASTDSCEK